MAIRYYLRSTTLAQSLWGITHELQMDTTVQVGGGTGTTSSSVGNGTTDNLFIFATPSNEPNQATWPNPAADPGDYEWSLDISDAGANMTYGPGTTTTTNALYRQAADLTSQNAASNIGAGLLFSGTGIKTFSDTSGTAPASIGGASDRAAFVIVGQNNNSMHSNETVTLDVDSADSWFEGPWTVAYQPRHGFVNHQNPGVV